MSGPELSVECGLRNRKNQAAYLLAHNSPTKSRREFLPSRSLHIYQNKLAQRVNLVIFDADPTVFLKISISFSPVR